MKIIVHYGSGTDNDSDVYLNSHSRTDFGDVRFTKNDGTTLLDYWMESKVDSNNAVFWVEVADDLSSNSVTIYVYYGKSNATTTSNGTNTFLFFDDFESYTADTDINGQGGWVTKRVGGSGEAKVRVLNGRKHLHIKSTDYQTVVVHSCDVPNSRMLTVYKVADDWDEAFNMGFGDGQYSTYGFNNAYDIAWCGWLGAYSRIRKWVSGGATNLASISDSDQNNVYHILDFSWYSSNLKAFRDRQQKLSATDSTFTSQTYIHLHCYSGSSHYVDWVYLRKYVEPEPSHGSWGSEEVPILSKTCQEILSSADKFVRTYSTFQQGTLTCQGLLKALPGILKVEFCSFGVFDEGVFDPNIFETGDVLFRDVSISREEDLTSIDSFSRALSYFLTQLESFSIVGVLKRAIEILKTEVSSLLDQLVKQIFKFYFEMLPLSDVFLKFWSLLVTEFVIFQDAMTQTRETVRILIEPLSLSDLFSRTWTILRSFSQSVTFSDLISSVFSVFRTQTLSLSDILTRYGIAVRTEIYILYDLLVKETSKFNFETFSLLDILQKTLSLVKAGLISFQDIVRKIPATLREETQTFYETISKVVFTLYLETTSLLEQFKSIFLKSFVETLNLQSIFSHVTSQLKPLIESLSLFSVQAFKQLKVFLESFALSDLKFISILRSCLEGISLTSILSAIKSFIRFVLESLTVSDSVQYLIGGILSLFETFSLVEQTFFRSSFIRVFSELFSVQDTLRSTFSFLKTEFLVIMDKISKVSRILKTEIFLLAGFLFRSLNKLYSETLSLVDNILKQIHLFRTVPFVLSDQFSKVAQALRSFAETVSVLESLSFISKIIKTEALPLIDSSLRIFNAIRLFSESLQATSNIFFLRLKILKETVSFALVRAVKLIISKVETTVLSEVVIISRALIHLLLVESLRLLEALKFPLKYLEYLRYVQTTLKQSYSSMVLWKQSHFVKVLQATSYEAYAFLKRSYFVRILKKIFETITKTKEKE